MLALVMFLAGACCHLLLSNWVGLRWACIIWLALFGFVALLCALGKLWFDYEDKKLEAKAEARRDAYWAAVEAKSKTPEAQRHRKHAYRMRGPDWKPEDGPDGE